MATRAGEARHWRCSSGEAQNESEPTLGPLMCGQRLPRSTHYSGGRASRVDTIQSAKSCQSRQSRVGTLVGMSKQWGLGSAPVKRSGRQCEPHVLGKAQEDGRGKNRLATNYRCGTGHSTGRSNCPAVRGQKEQKQRTRSIANQTQKVLFALMGRTDDLLIGQFHENCCLSRAACHESRHWHGDQRTQQLMHCAP